MATKQQQSTKGRKAIGFGRMFSIMYDAIGQSFLVLGQIMHAISSITQVGEAHAVTFNHTEMNKLKQKHSDLMDELTLDFDDDK